MLNYLNGIRHYVRAVYKAKAKKHGAGSQPWKYAHAMGKCYYYLVYTQNKRKK